MALQPLTKIADTFLKHWNAEQLTKELRSTAPFLIPFLKMTCIYFVLWLDNGTFPAACVKCLPLLSLIWFVCLLGVSDPLKHRYNRKIIAALISCCTGDFFLIWGENSQIYFILGLSCFAIGHIIYSFAFGWSPFGLKEFVFTFTVCLPVVAAISLCVDGMMKYAAVIYAILLLVMEWRALARFNLQGEIPWRKIYAAIGATLFVISDTVLAINKFCSPVAGERYIVMVTYFAAQLLIALSVVNSGVAVSTSVAIGDQKNRNTNIHSNGLTVNHKNSETCSKSDDVMHNSHMDNDLIKMTSSPS